MEPIYLQEVQQAATAGPAGKRIVDMESLGLPVPQIWYLIAYKPEMTRHLARFTQGVMRGPSPLSPGQRELIAAFTSSGNHCLF